MGEQEVQEGLSRHHCGAPVLRISIAEVLLLIFTTWGRPVRKSRTQLHREGFRPRAPNLVISMEGTMVLKVVGLGCQVRWSYYRPKARAAFSLQSWLSFSLVLLLSLCRHRKRHQSSSCFPAGRLPEAKVSNRRTVRHPRTGTDVLLILCVCFLKCVNQPLGMFSN
jgi:hypothetical protein